MTQIIDFVLHVDRYLLQFVDAYGAGWVYALLFGIVFAETGLVVTPFLPGDSLLFAAGAVATSTGALNPWLTMALLFSAAFLGNACNYTIGRFIGPKVFRATDQASWSHKLLNRKHLDQAHAFFEKHGGMAVVLGRFVPIVRTFVPFVAGAASMSSASFVFYNFIGAAAWVVLCVGAGLLFGQVPFVRNNFSLVTIGIVLVSILPIVIELIRHKRRTELTKIKTVDTEGAE
jgi:membrane-associated protein